MKTRSTPPPKIPQAVQAEGTRPTSSSTPAKDVETPLGPSASVHRSDGTAAAERARSGTAGTLVGPGTVHALDARTVAFLDQLAAIGVPAKILDLLREDLDLAANEGRLRAAVEARYAKPWEREKIEKALEVAKKAHEGQTQKRKNETSGLDHVPYANHPIRIATWAAELGLSAEAVQAALLHDVVEDTKVSLEVLRKDFSPAVLELVDALTKKKTESRAEYLAHVAALTGEVSAIKCLDRIHNLLRGFSTRDPAYLERYLTESREIYAPKMEQLPALKPLFDTLVTELDTFRAKLSAPAAP